MRDSAVGIKDPPDGSASAPSCSVQCNDWSDSEFRNLAVLRIQQGPRATAYDIHKLMPSRTEAEIKFALRTGRYRRQLTEARETLGSQGSTTSVIATGPLPTPEFDKSDVANSASPAHSIETDAPVRVEQPVPLPTPSNTGKAQLERDGCDYGGGKAPRDRLDGLTPCTVSKKASRTATPPPILEAHSVPDPSPALWADSDTLPDRVLDLSDPSTRGRGVWRFHLTTAHQVTFKGLTASEPRRRALKSHEVCSHGRWSEAEMCLVAQIELSLPPGERFINKAIANQYLERSHDSIKALRHRDDYKLLVEKERERSWLEASSSEKQNPNIEIPHTDIHAVYDPIFSAPSEDVSTISITPASFPDEAPPFSREEVEWAFRVMRADSAPGPDGLTLRELRKIPSAITALILNNWLCHHHMPDELRESRTVFIPKTSAAPNPSELRPITISSVIVRLYTRLILSRLQEMYSFSPFQNGFSDDRSAQSNLLLLQGIMRHCKQARKPFYAASLDLQKAFDSSWGDWMRTYENQGLFAYLGDTLGNRWLQPQARLMGDGDRIKSLRLRANLYPTRYLSNRGARDPKARLCRRCGTHDETAFHILQKCTSIHSPRIVRHNFIEQAIVKKLIFIHPDTTIATEKVITDREGVRHRPDIVRDLPSKTYVVDVAIPWDNSVKAMEHANQEKRRKYNPILHVMPKPTKVLGLAFGARGLVCPRTRRAAKEIGLRDSDIAWLAARALVGSLICLNRFSKIVTP
ncbi:hypothetical protein HPB48_008839 [Haemaphysalis longicornis]|uniref:Reverse transcriptase domain-containing protein n=1 Tax=Haemaphysalis longicornis TaxID=44386 RepID=A0A9J6H4R6_HAELO|nr:hypothetical protein HPB48_008839 [Haemaphysalis longicornis]